MTAGAYAHPTVSRFAIADGMFHFDGFPIGLPAEPAGATPFFAYEVASAGETAVALDTPVPADRVNIAGPGKAPAELSRTVAARVPISLSAMSTSAVGSVSRTSNATRRWTSRPSARTLLR
jgi:hypothetical protein